MSSSATPGAGPTGEQSNQPIIAGEQAAGGRRPRASKSSGAIQPVDFAGHEDLLANLKAFGQFMDIDINRYIVEAVSARFKADREKVKKDFGTKKQ